MNDRPFAQRGGGGDGGQRRQGGGINHAPQAAVCSVNRVDSTADTLRLRVADGRASFTLPKASTTCCN